MYLWDNELDKVRLPSWKVIKMQIYGVKSSSSQADQGLRLTAEKCALKYPRVCQIIDKDIYVDDCVSGEASWDRVRTVSFSVGLF